MLRSTSIRLLCTLLLLTLGATLTHAASPFPFRSGERVLFLGDSITYAGGYVQYLDAYLATRFPERRIELINLGLASETVSGLSEPDHPWPRPNVHTRLAQALARTRPQWVVACYGMNDGIYYPFSGERLRKYQEGIGKLVEQCRAAGARVLLMTPSAFDAHAVRKSVLPLGAPKYGWMTPFEDYDGVLSRYSAWLLSLRAPDLRVADAHGTVKSHLEVSRPARGAYVLAEDGVHPNPSGQWLIAEALLTTLRAPAEADSAEIDAATLRAPGARVSGLRKEGETLYFEWTSRIPMPLDAGWDPQVRKRLALHETLNRYRLRITGLTRPMYALVEEGRPVGALTRAELEQGVDLLRFPELSTNRAAQEILERVRERERLLSPAWLTAVGHTRPDTPSGLPLAEAQRRAAPLTEQIRALSRPRTLRLQLRPLS